MINTPLFTSLDRLQRLYNIRENLNLLAGKAFGPYLYRVRDKLDAAMVRERMFMERNRDKWLDIEGD